MTKEAKLIEDHLLIADKKRKIVPFKLNKVQQMYDESKTNRDIILKARQEGFTSLILAYFLMDCLKTKNTRSVVVGHDKEATQKLLDRVRFYLKYFHKGEDFVEVDLRTDTKNELYFPETDSRFYIGTQGSVSFGRSDTLHNVLLTEFAMYDNPEDILTSITGAVPKDGRIVIETTANGFNYFRELYYEAKAGTRGYKAHFYPWTLHKEYRIENKGKMKLDKDEKRLFKMGITKAQIRWRRDKMAEYPSKKEFQQEYPAYEDEAFISSGRKAFNTEALKEYLVNVNEAKDVAFINEKGQISPNPEGFLKIWKYPEDGHKYVLGADVAEGLEHNDYSSSHVMDRETMEVVAIWHGHIDPDLFGYELVGLAKFYNGATIGCESNNHGLTTIGRMRELQYPAIYQRRKMNAVSQSTVSEFGWKTDLKTKPILRDDLEEMLRERHLEIHDVDTIKELMAYEIDEKGKLSAPKGIHDDRVISLAIAVQMRKLTSSIDYQPTADLPPDSIHHIFERAKKKTKERGFKSGNKF